MRPDVEIQEITRAVEQKAETARAKFDKTAYQREYMRKRRAAAKV